MSFQRRLVPFVFVLSAFVACGPMKVEPELALTASPRQLDGVGQTSVLKITAVDDLAKPGTGKVRLTSTAGSLKDGVDVDLLAGEGVAEFACVRASEPACTGSIRITAEWVAGGKLVSAATSVSIAAAVDAGVDAGTPVDAGVIDAGVIDAGLPIVDAGVDAGADPGDAGLTLVSAKPALIAGTGDSVVLTATVTRAGQPVDATPVTFTTNRGSFTPTSGTLMTTAMSNAAGVATATLHASTAAAGLANVTAAASGLQATADVQIVSVANLNYVPSSNTASYLVVRNAGSAAIGTTMTTLFWKVTDSNNMGVPGVLVTFAVNAGGAAGSTITPQAISDAQGNVQTTLSSGDSPGSITVRATVAATAGTASEISVTHPGTNVIFGVPSDSNFTFTCTRKNLGALHVAGIPPPTRMGVTTPCTVQIQDRGGNLIPGGVPAQFIQEAGSLSPNPTTIMAGSGVVTYNALSNTLPLDVAPVAGEPTYAAGNPRDMLVTLVAIIAGEEQFFDSSGNGQWEPGEWFVDMGEPFVDSNDNGVRDGIELYFDTEPRNGRYDGPNGVWDNNIQIFRTTHVLWTGPFASPVWGLSPPWTVGSSPLVVPFYWGDVYGNPISPDGAGFSASLVGTTKGAVTFNAGSFSLDGFGMPLSTEPPVTVTESAAGSGVFTFGANCDNPIGMVPNALTRCLRRTRFASTGWSGGGTPATLTLTNASGPSTSGNVVLQPTHSYSGSAPLNAPVTFSLQP